MARRVTVAVLALLASVVLTNSAWAAENIYLVQGTADSGLASCTPIPTVPNGLHCDSLRAAVTAANANVGQSDAIFLQGSDVLDVSSSRPREIAALAVRNARNAVLLLANLTPTPKAIEFGSARTLDGYGTARIQL